MTAKDWFEEYYLFCDRIEKAKEAYDSGEIDMPSLSSPDFAQLPVEFQLAHPLYYPNVPSVFPPYGLEMPFEVFCELFSKYPNYQLPKYSWCATGREVHDLIRLACGYRTLYSIGLYTPRQGYYKIVEEDNLFYHAYFNFREPLFAEFESQLVKISKKPLYSTLAITHIPLKVAQVGDIMQVAERTRLRTFLDSEGNEIKAYQVIWKIIGG